MTAAEFLQQLVNGLSLGSTFALVALGYTLVFGVLQIINMAHGEVFTAGAFIGLFAARATGGNLPLATLAAMAGAGLIGLVLERVALRPLRSRGASTLAALISTIGLATVMQTLAIEVFGAEGRPFPGGETALLRVGPVQVRQLDLTILALSLGLMAGLRLLLLRTRVGRALRATADNPNMAQLLGVNTGRMITLTVVLASALGGAAGVLVGAVTAVDPVMGLPYGLKGLAVIILGGLGSIPGAVAGGLLLGVIEVFAVAFGAASYREAVAFGLLFLILVVRPSGLFGKTAAKGGRA